MATPGHEALDQLESRREAFVGLAQGDLRLHAQPLGQVGDDEQDIAQFQPQLVGAGRLALFADFLGQLVIDAANVGPVETGGRRLGLDFLRADERRQGLRDAVEFGLHRPNY